MSFDLQTLFDEAGYDGPTGDVDCDYIVRRGRRARARRQVLVGGTAILGASVVAVAGSNLVHDAGSSASGGSASSGQPAPSSSMTATPSPSLPVGFAGQLDGVTLPDPAPGFPIRRVPDNAPRNMPLDGDSSPAYWVRSFLLAEKPGITTTDSSGNVSGRPTGPEVTMLVGNFPAEWSAAHAGGRPSSQAQVAGVVGDVYASTEKGVPMLFLTFQRGPFSVFIQGSGGATVDKLVALGNALTGLVVPSASPMPATSAPSVSPVVTVSAGQKVDLGSGSYLTVTASEKCYMLADPPNPSTPECKSLTDGNQAAKSISLQSGSAGAGKPTVMTGIYTGTDASLITVTSGGVTRAATIVMLGAHPNSLIYYLVWPTSLPAGAAAHGDLTIEAFDSSGGSLAKLGG